jgi:tRNA-2-methylthio-N6-dimethylallyladenosine synthase
MASNERVCNGIHLPLQSGSDPVLKRMNRKYSADEYLGKIDKLRQVIPEVVITTDIIVGFPGETQDDFDWTLDMVKRISYDSSFMFRYSVREGTRAAGFEDDVPEEEKLSRLTQLIELQKEISTAKMKARIGSIQNVLIETNARQNPADGLGKNDGGLNVIVRNAADCHGSFVKSEIVDSTYTTLIGKPIRE